MCPGFVRCASPLPRERRRHTLLAEPVRLDKPPEADQPAAARRWLLCDAGRVPTRRADPCRAPGVEESAGTRVVHVPYVVEQDEDGVWSASAQLRPGVGAVGDGPTAEAAVIDLRDALEALLAGVGPPDELTLTLDVA